MASSSSSPTKIPKKYDVFLSFRGEDTRDNFTDHLAYALKQKDIKRFIDDELTRGDEISQSLLKAIEESYISVIIFSKGYASSGWCLDELVKILKCKKKYGQVVIPVFYRVDPSDVRKQTGIYRESFSKLEERFQGRLDKLQKWRNALTKAANLSGFHSHVYRSESKLIRNIVNEILKRMEILFPSENKDQPIGVESRILEIESLLDIGSNNVYKLGIWGIGGIGKTTIATAVFNKNSSYFEGSCFIPNVREESEKVGGLDQLKSKLLSTLLNEENAKINSSYNIRRLSQKKVLIVLDDVAQLEESTIRSLDCVGKGSRIIITSRDEHVLDICRVNGKYKVNELVHDAALELFCRHAFEKNDPNVGYEKLRKVIDYAQGLPLALKVLGGDLFGRSEEYWESKINKLKEIPDMEIQKVLKVSYDSLDRDEKNIFLDIACFFKGEDEDLVKKFLVASGFYLEAGITKLTDKCLITISDNKVTMHDLLQEMGREIVRQESVEGPGKRSRLWHHDDIYQVFQNNKVTEAIEGIFLDMSKIEIMRLQPDCFKKMDRLRFLNFFDYKNNINKVHIQDVEPSSMKLRYLHWSGCPLKSLSICPEKLVSLEMVDSKVEQLWDGVQNLVNLKEIRLSGSRQLTKLPDLSTSQNLENLILGDCSSLVEIHPSIQYLNKLVVLVLYSCKSLTSLPHFSSCNLNFLNLNGSAIEELPSSIIDCLYGQENLNLRNCSRLERLPSSLFKLESLRQLHLCGCSNLKRLPEISSCNLEILNLAGSAIEELPSSIECLSRLKSLHLSKCSWLQSLPISLCKMKSLRHLTLSGCSNLQRLPEQMSFILPILLSSEGLHNLENLSLIDCGITELPESLGQLSSLRYLYLDKNNFERIPESVINLSKLEILLLNYCERLQSLPNLPYSLQFLEANHCMSLEPLSGLFTIQESDQTISLRNCIKLDEGKLKKIVDSALHKIQLEATARSKKQVKQNLVHHRNHGSGICYPGREIPEWFKYQSMGSSLTVKLPPGDRFNNDFLGFAYCAIVAFEDHHQSEKDFHLHCELKLKTADGECKVAGRFEYVGYGEADHVIFGYVPVPRYMKRLSIRSVSTFFIEFYLKDGIRKRIKCCEVVKKCGFRLLGKKDGNRSFRSTCE